MGHLKGTEARVAQPGDPPTCTFPRKQGNQHPHFCPLTRDSSLNSPALQKALMAQPLTVSLPHCIPPSRPGPAASDLAHRFPHLPLHSDCRISLAFCSRLILTIPHPYPTLHTHTGLPWLCLISSSQTSQELCPLCC